MVFDSFLFWYFYAAVLLAYFRLPHRGQNALLLAASYVFYACWDWRFLGLIWASTAVDYAVGRALARTDAPARRRALLLASVGTNLSILGFFKYWDFFARELGGLLAAIGLAAAPPTLELILPVGISFYTFQTMSYTIDVYRRRTPACADRLDFALFVAFFPQLVAGPIERAGRLIGQISRPRSPGVEDVRAGTYLVLVGLFKKVVLADSLAPLVEAVFTGDAAARTGPEVAMGAYAFALQIYGDFSGYSSIAQGVARWLGFHLTDNFRHPFFARDLGDLWRRWHVSLSTWLRDYVFVPLGGGQGGAVRTARNALVTFALCGLWHGAAWTYVAWGTFHGALLAARALLRGAARPGGELPWALGDAWRVALTFHLFVVSALFFRAESVSHSVQLAVALVDRPVMTDLAAAGLAMVVFYSAPLLLFEAWLERRGDLYALLSAPWPARAAVQGYMVWMLVLFHPGAKSVFYYFRF
ncbi:MAG: MBOAT family protein [Planctomycetes bacterium]|nr:MBOAT family protein [Planctomycetota bacterium]